MAPTHLRGEDKKPYNVLVTGFGPFFAAPQNPSWLSVHPLNDLILYTLTRSIHFTAFRVPTAYAAILHLIPAVHARPPRLPETQYPASPTGKEPPYGPGDPEPQPMPDTPEEGYDLVIHVGLGHSGGLRLEDRAHKTGYRTEDYDGCLPPIVPPSTFWSAASSSATSSGSSAAAERRGLSEAERAEMARLGLGPLLEQEKEKEGKKERRGFGQGYEGFEEVLKTEGDVDALVDYLRKEGFEHTARSTDAGHYCCDFIYYCSLAEALRTQQQQKTEGEGKKTKVQFMHIPPLGEPYSAQDVMGAVKRIAEFYAGLED